MDETQRLTGATHSAVVSMPTELDITNARPFGEELIAALVLGNAVVIADMTNTRFCDSSGARALAIAHRQAAALKAELWLVVPSASVLRTLSLSGLDQLIPIYQTLDEALAPAPRPVSCPRPSRSLAPG